MKHFVGLSKKAVSFLLALLLTAAGTTAAFAAEPEDALIKGAFTMTTFDGFDPGEQTYYYSDSYFTASGKETNEHLRTMSAALVFPLRGISDTPEETYGAILNDTGFKDITAYDLDHTSLETMGVLLAHKTVDGKELIAVALRGDKYEHEMAANLIAGNEGDVKAFADAEKLVESRVGAYLAEHGITSAKYWVTGYSRSGAVANIFGRELNKYPEKFFTTDDDIYVYAMEPANGSADDTVYENIHNIIDRRDLITYIYPNAWGLYSNGVPEYIGSIDDTIMIKTLDLFSESHVADLEEMNTVDYLNELTSFFSKKLSRETFIEKLGAPLSVILNIFYDLDEEKRSEVLTFFQQVFSEVMKDNDIIPIMLKAVFVPSSQKNINDLAALIAKHLDKAALEYGKPMDDESFEVVKASLTPILEALLPVVSADMTSSIAHGDGSYPTTAALYHILTLAGNLMPILKNHFNYNVFNELKASDSYYDERKDDFIPGDVNLDGKVTIDDATMIQQYLAKLIDFDDAQKKAADANADGEITIDDTTAIQLYLADMIDRLG